MNHSRAIRKTPWFLASACLIACMMAHSPLLYSDAQGKDAPPTQKPVSNGTPSTNLKLEQKQFPQGTLYALKVPKNAGFKVVPVLSKTLANIESSIWQNAAAPQKPLFIINAGFFDPNNSLTTSFVFNKGVLTGDPRINPQLVNNPKLVPYLPKIFNRSEFRVYLCQKQEGQFETQYDIVPHNASVPDTCLLQESIGAGPALLPKLEDFSEGFVDYNAAGKITRDPVGVCAKNARSVVGLTANGDVLLLMGAQNSAQAKNSGFSLPEMANLLKSRGAVKAMALDGGSSSSILFSGKPVYGKLNPEGDGIRRPVKSVLMVLPD